VQLKQFGRNFDKLQDQGPSSLFPVDLNQSDEPRFGAGPSLSGNNKHDDKSNDVYSGLSELEDRRDRGRSSTPSKLDDNKFGKSFSGEEASEPVQVVHCLRLLSAMEDSLGSLGPSVNQILGRALSLENSRNGASKILLEDPDTVTLLDMVKEKLSGQLAAGLLQRHRQDVAQVCLTNIARLLSVATKKRIENVSIVSSKNQNKELEKSNNEEDDRIKAEAMFSETLAMTLLQNGQGDVSDEELEAIIDQLMKITAQDDPNSSLGKYAKNYLNVCVSENTQQYIQKVPDVKKEKGVDVVTLDDDNEFGDNNTQKMNTSDQLEDLTIQDLQSLLTSFNTLSKIEQNDLINYMKKLEATDPEKVSLLKEGMKNFKPTSDREERNDWSPPFNKRARRLSGSSMEMNPVNPEAEARVNDEGRSNWKPVNDLSESSRSTFRSWQGSNSQEEEIEQIPLNQMYTDRPAVQFGRNFDGRQVRDSGFVDRQPQPFNSMSRGMQNMRHQDYDKW